MLACEHYWSTWRILSQDKEGITRQISQQIYQKSYNVEIPAILQKKPNKIAVKEFEISDWRIGVWTRTQADVKQKGWKGKR